MKVLIVEDDPAMLAIARLSLGRIGGMTVLEAGGGADGLALAESERPDVIVLDVVMPSMDGPATLAALRANPATAGLPVVFLTARSSPEEIDRLMRLGAVGVLRKPFNPAALAGDLLAILQDRR